MNENGRPEDIDECQTCGWQPLTADDMAAHVHCPECGALPDDEHDHPALLHVLHDGVEEFHGTEPECFRFILFHQGQSVSYATKYGGWKLELVTPCPSPYQQGLEDGLAGLVTGVTFDDDPNSPRSVEYDRGRTEGERRAEEAE